MASSSSSVSWMPAPGRHVVNIGPSLGKALKAKKLKASPAATATTKRSNLPERDFYSFRFNFKPPSIDTTKPASIEIQKGADNTKVTAEYPSTQSGEALIFLGAEQPAKEVDCVLIYDEDTGTYSLEKLDSFVNLHYDQRTTVSRRPSPAPKAAPPTQKTTKGKGKQSEIMDDLERELLGLDEDAEGDPDISMMPPSKPMARKEEEEEGDVKPPKPPPTAQPPLPQKVRPVKPIPKSRVEAKEPVAVSRPPRLKPTQLPPNAIPVVPVPAPSTSAPTRTKPRPVQTKGQAEQREPVQQTGSIPKKESAQKTESVPKKEPPQKKKKAKPIPDPPPLPTAPPKSAPYGDEEAIGSGRPAKRPRPSTPQQPLLPPTPPAPVTLSLPGGSSSFAPPRLPPGSHNSRSAGGSSRNVPPPAVPPSLSLPTSAPASPPMMGQYESDEEEDWDEVSTVNPASVSASLPPSNSVDDNATAYELALEQEIFGDDVFEEVDGDEERQVTTQSYVDGGDGEEEEIDVSAFEQELNEHMMVEVGDDSDDDVFGGLAGESEPDLQDGTRQPISMNRLASGGAGVEMSEDDYSSSDDSDDD